MYASAAAALVGEIFGKNKWSLLISGLLVPAAWVAIRTYLATLSSGTPIISTPFGFLILVALALQLGAVFAYVDFTADSKSGFPRHILLLPLPTWLLALVPILAGSVFISAFVLLWLHFLSDIQVDWRRQLTFAAGITSLMCWIQAMSWELLPPRGLRMAVLIVAVAVGLVSVLSVTAQDPDMLLGRTGGTIGLLVTGLGGLALAYLAVIRSRRGESLDIAGVVQRGIAPLRPPRGATMLPKLASGVAAQDWYEWRVYGRLLPMFMGFLVAGPLAAAAFGGIHRIPSMLLPAMMLFVFLAMTPLMGAAYISKNFTRRVQPGSFGATRPLADLEIAFAKLKVTVKSHAAGVSIVFAAMAIVLARSTNHALLLSVWSSVVAQLGAVSAWLVLLAGLLLATATSWALTLYFMSLQLFGECIDKKKHGWKLSLAVMALFLLLLRLGRAIFLARESLLAWLARVHYELLLPVLVLAAAGVWLLRRLKRTHELRAFAKLGGGFGVAGALCLSMVWQLHLPIGYRWSLACLVVVDTLLVFLPLLLVPVLIGLGRHR